ncbi:MAG: phosphoglucosamine mutase [Bacteroidales bacterium]|jgi:phosphomannomutase|nr:phosphoglucosamine mutase [Bacteroidales bacterium]MDD2264618.1 phosphoglucosamine mutase [Bacteroidales bacterium]MDD2832001.1 phosphoglucosamine mutase [Bacteroidales bacterium]MDD3209004.1 phosphoglucosamine mutase [Bacteroidales bacterium]MDD3697838.1 phosphoglucosamine mutase [Bacteroidales bacterium]
MSLIKSISGIRGTIGGLPGVSLSPLDIVLFTSAYARLIKESYTRERHKIVVGRDARISGDMIRQIVCGTLRACGIDVIDTGLASTPTTEMAVVFSGASGGIIITASHNPRQWNALKLLGPEGEFLNAIQGERLLALVRENAFEFANVDSLGQYRTADYAGRHIETVLNHPLLNVEAIYRAGFSVVLDGINSVGGLIMPKLLESLGVTCHQIHCEPTGDFAHNPEPLPQNLTDLSVQVVARNATMGISVDPDVDRLAFICEDGSMFGEEYTLVACADYVLDKYKTAHPEDRLHTVSNLSSTRALKDITLKHRGTYSAAAVGEVNVVEEMKRTGSIIGGEGNGGVILPSLHYGRDALIGTALFLSLLAERGLSMTQLRSTYPGYHMSKNRVDLKEEISMEALSCRIKKAYPDASVSHVDGLRLDFENEKKWVSLRKSNTEPILRIYSEAPRKEQADSLASEIMALL